MENFATTSDPSFDTHSKDIAAGDRHAPEEHEKLKKMGYSGWAYDKQAVKDYDEMYRQHKGNSGL